ncbi:MAG: DUF302 domain-containing protein [Curvibacter sp.]|nr:MAG: DUF302 domain-containing protein [Curvibacter sp.]
MIKIAAAALFACASASALADDRGMNVVASPFDMDHTVLRVESALREKGVKIFAIVDHAEEARAAGMDLPPTKLLIVGNPKAGTPLMQRDQAVGIDLPLKLLIWRTPSGEVDVGWNSPEYLAKRHALPDGFERPLGALGGIVSQALRP